LGFGIFLEYHIEDNGRGIDKSKEMIGTEQGMSQCSMVVVWFKTAKKTTAVGSYTAWFLTSRIN